MQIDIRWKLLREWLLAIPSSKQRPRQRQSKFRRLLRPCCGVFCGPSFIFSTLAPHPTSSFSFASFHEDSFLSETVYHFLTACWYANWNAFLALPKELPVLLVRLPFGFHPFLGSCVFGYSWPQNGHKCFSYLFEWQLAIRPEASPNGLCDFRLEWS